MNTLNTSQQFAKSLTDESDSEYRRLRTNFDNFLDSTPLLNHFIECDENGVPMEKPKDYDLWLNAEHGFSGNVVLCNQFYKAKKQVLFEGWEIKHSENPFKITNGFIEIEFWNYSNGNTQIFITDFSIEKPKQEPIYLYSDLTKYNLKTNENFKNLIYGK